MNNNQPEVNTRVIRRKLRKFNVRSVEHNPNMNDISMENSLAEQIVENTQSVHQSEMDVEDADIFLVGLRLANELEILT